MSKASNSGLLRRATDYIQLVRRMVDAGHDFEALEMAKTILDRGKRQFSFDPALDQRGAAICTPDEFVRVQELLKWMEGPDGAALDGNGPEPDLLHGGRRFGSVGMPWRRRALRTAAADFEHAQGWKSRIQQVFSGPDSEWRWKDAGWFHGHPFGDIAHFLFQPVVVFIAPGRSMLERASSVIEQLLPVASPIPISLAHAGEKSLRAPCSAVALLDSSASNPPEVIQFLKAMVEGRKECARSGWPVPDVEIVVLNGDPVWVCLTEAIRLGKAADEFPRMWEQAVKGEGELTGVYRAATAPEAAAGIVQELIGETCGLLSGNESGVLREEKCSAARIVVLLESNLHLLAEHLRRANGETEVEVRTLDRVRHIDRSKIVAHHFEGVGSIEVARESVAEASRARWPSILYSEQEQQDLLEKWSTERGDEEAVVYVFPHIPKTAGSSVHFHLKTEMAYDSEYIHIPIDNTTSAELRMRPFTLRDERDRARAKILFGHGVIQRYAEFVPGKTVREIVTLRDPVERMLSHYNFWMNVLEKRGSEPMTFEQWYAGEPRNYHVNWIAKNYLGADTENMPAAEAFAVAKETLDKFWMVCTMPTFERDISRLWTALGLPPMKLRQNVSGVTHEKRFECDEALRRRLIEENAFDHELYLSWVARNRARDAATVPSA